jgi:hypothetical protein
MLVKDRAGCLHQCTDREVTYRLADLRGGSFDNLLQFRWEAEIDSRIALCGYGCHGLPSLLLPVYVIVLYNLCVILTYNANKMFGVHARCP